MLRALCGIGLLILGPLSFAADWPQWHGLHRDYHSPEAGLLKEWPADGLKPVWVTVRQLMKVSDTFEAGPFGSPRSVQDRLLKLRAAGWVQSWR